MSKYDYPNVCPKCGAKPYRSCVTGPKAKHPGKATDTHRQRIEDQSADPRYVPIRDALKGVYGPSGLVAMVAYHMASRWEDYVERSRRYDPDDAERTEEALFREVQNHIWLNFPGGTTAEHAANMVKKALIEADLWSTA